MKTSFLSINCNFGVTEVDIVFRGILYSSVLQVIIRSLVLTNLILKFLSHLTFFCIASNVCILGNTLANNFAIIPSLTSKY